MAAAPTSAQTYDSEKYEMFVDEETMVAFNGSPISWFDQDTWRADGMDPTLFPHSELPMKRVALPSDNRLTPFIDHYIALKYFAMAHRAGTVRGSPRFLISLLMAPADLATAIWDRSVKVYPEIDTLAFTRTVNQENYPAVQDVVANPISDVDGAQLLAAGYLLLNPPVV